MKFNRNFYATLIFKHSDWLFKIFNQTEYFKIGIPSVNLYWKFIYNIEPRL